MFEIKSFRRIKAWIEDSGQEIKSIFEVALKKAPVILFFDEIELLISERDSDLINGYEKVVNEFLSQLDNIGDSGLFVIGATDKPHLIDKAFLQAGRLDKFFYIPPPDFETRKVMFEIDIKNKPHSGEFDYDKLATLTENYSVGDINQICKEASLKAIREKTRKISMETLEYVIAHRKSSISHDDIKKYESIRDQLESNAG